jgi:ADP-heptose:LPS heptosyltransferase
LKHLPASLPSSLVISRTDNIGDVVLTLPLAGYLKSLHPSMRITFLGKAYTAPIIRQSRFIDTFLDQAEVLQNPALLSGHEAILFAFPDKGIAQAAQKARIPVRIGTSHRWFHWLYANRLVHFSRRHSALHEAQLNFKLLKPLGIDYIPSLSEIPAWYGLEAPQVMLPPAIAAALRTPKFALVVHPKSRGSAREWTLSQYEELLRQLGTGDYQFFLTGTAAEGELIQQQHPQLLQVPGVINCTGQLGLGELLALVAQTDGLLACSTGPLHLAAALGKLALGIYPPMPPLHPGRWQPLGVNAQVLVLDKPGCQDCKRTLPCHCIEAIGVGQVAQTLETFRKKSAIGGV